MGIDFTAEQYVDDVLSGCQVACKWIRLACERHRRDLERGYERGLFFDETAAKLVIAFFHGVLRHSKGEWAGLPVSLEPWQQFMLWSLFGWKRDDGTRRFRVSYNEVARKNGKSTIGAGIGLFLTVADGEPGAEVYTAATKLDQARIIHQESVRMVNQSPVLKREVQVFKNSISSTSTYSKYEPLGRDSKTLDGLNVHGAMVDELHAHPTGEMFDVLDTATSARRQPLIYNVTTAGDNRQTICWQFHDYTEKILSGVIDDDAWHGLIFTLDHDEEGELENWEDETVWVKANPNLGVSKKWSDMRDKARKASQMPARLNVFQQKELNIWTQGSARWVLPERWRALNMYPLIYDDLAGRRAYGGLDLSSTIDLTALVWALLPARSDTPLDIFCHFWIPEENILERVRNDRVPYNVWVKQGWITTTPGNVVDYDFILHQVRQDMNHFNVAEIAFDSWNATHVSNKLIEEGVEMVEFRQGYVSMNPAMKSLEVAVKNQSINHGGNPVLTWNADNLVVSMDPAGNQKPDKSKSREKIDGMVSLIMSHYRATLGGGGGRSAYEDRGLRIL